MGFGQFLLSHQGMVEDLTGLLLAFTAAFGFIGVPTIISRSRHELDGQYAGDPMFGTFFAKDHRHRPN